MNFKDYHHAYADFLAQAKQNADQEALICDGNRVTYGKLNQDSTIVAKYLFLNRISSRDTVGIMPGNGIQYIVAVLGILKTEAAYLTLDPTNSIKKLNQTLSDCRIKLVLLACDNDYPLSVNTKPVRSILSEKYSVLLS